jgi:hypothetical protein
MTSEMKSLLGQLQAAIDEAISESSHVGNIVEEMKRVGYDVCLILESTVSISPTQGSQPPDFVPEPQLASNGEIRLTDEDLEFLQELNIAA